MMRGNFPSCVLFSCEVGARGRWPGLRGEAKFTGQHVPRRLDGSVSAEPGLRDKEEGQGLSSDGIHTEDVETDIVRGEQSFLLFFFSLPLLAPAAKDSTRQAEDERL